MIDEFNKRLDRLCKCYPSRLTPEFKGNIIPSMDWVRSWSDFARWQDIVEKDMQRIESEEKK